MHHRIVCPPRAMCNVRFPPKADIQSSYPPLGEGGDPRCESQGGGHSDDSQPIQVAFAFSGFALSYCFYPCDAPKQQSLPPEKVGVRR